MNRKKIISLIIAVFTILAPLSYSFAAPSPTPDNQTSTVTSPDGTTKTVNSDGETVTPAPKKQDNNKDDNEDEDDEENEDSESDDEDSESESNTENTTSSTASTQLEAGMTMEDPTLTPPDVSHAESALLMDMGSGRVLYSKNLDKQVYPASVTKIMTGILALEMGNMSDTVTATYDALKTITLEDSAMGILVGEELTMEQLVNGMLIHSANDAANVIAVHLAGSIEGFANVMNQKAQELGMTGTHFVNPCGAHDDNHYTTARDIAILAKYAMKNEQFREIVKTVNYHIDPTNKYTTERILTNTNLFLSTIRSTYHYYPPAIGIKTGSTSQAGYCLVSAAAYDGTELMAVVMNCANVDTKEQAYSYVDSRHLFDFGFDNYANKTLATVGDIVNDSKVYEAKNDMRVAITVDADVSALISNKDGNADLVKPVFDMPEKIAAPITKGDTLGTVTYYYNDIPVGSANLIATNDVERNNLLHIFHIILKVIISPFFFVPVIILILIMMFARQRKKKIERQKRIQQLKRQRQHNFPDNETGKRTPNRNASRTERVDRETKGSNSRYRK
ncbi:MAG: D-alanyl-D-alanine carboxypeptidase [Oscillospiraceae bacterium]|nr:D-alanyl-D-alanine carboxypeptidase [Oscillospiraceae bacterium]